MVRKIFILFISTMLLSSTCLAKSETAQLNTQADIIVEVRKDFVKSEKQLENIYKNINQAFGSDKEFINLLNKDKQNFYRTRELKRDVVLPHSHTSYGINNYEVYSPMYLIDLNNKQIDYLKNVVQTYCFYHSANSASLCKSENINKIFR